MAAADRFVTIRHVADPIEAEMWVDLLAQEGIPATIQGNTHSAMLGGLAAAAMRVPLQVPARDAERANQILDALEDFEPAESELEDVGSVPDALEMNYGEGPYRASALPDPVPPRRKAAAVAAAMFLPMVLGVFGAGHFYARSYGRGFALLAFGWTCIVFGVDGYGLAWLGLPLVVALDAAGAVHVIATRTRR